jgi:hypothetical protein
MSFTLLTITFDWLSTLGIGEEEEEEEIEEEITMEITSNGSLTFNEYVLTSSNPLVFDETNSEGKGEKEE